MSEINKAGDVRAIGGQMANVLFNLAQRPGEPLDAAACESLDTLRRQWDAAVRASPSTSGDERNAALNRAFDEGVKFGKEAAREEAAMLCNTHAQEQHKFHQHAEMYVADHLARKIRALKTANPSPIKAEPTGKQGVKTETYYVGAQNDALYITKGAMPARGNDNPIHDADRTAIAKVYSIDDANLIAAALNAYSPSLPPQGEAQAEPAGELYVECRECTACDHIGMNDAADDRAACNTCGWTGAEPVEDKCPECERVGTMSVACPKCGERYRLLDSETLSVAAAIAPQGQQATDYKDAFKLACADMNAVVVLLGLDGDNYTGVDAVLQAITDLMTAAPSIGQQAKAVAPEGFCLVPLLPNREMVRVMADDEWLWKDLLAAAEAITDAEYDAIPAAQALPVADTASADAVDAKRYRHIRETVVFERVNGKQDLMLFAPMFPDSHDFNVDFMEPAFSQSVDRTVDANMAAALQQTQGSRA